VTVSESFSITVEALDAGSSRGSRRLTAEGALTELGGELAFDAVTSLLKNGSVDITLDLSQVTSLEDAGLRWLRRCRMRVDASGGCLWTIGVTESYRASIPASPPQLVNPDQTVKRSLPTADGEVLGDYETLRSYDEPGTTRKPRPAS
jgi:hypothetical protein